MNTFTFETLSDSAKNISSYYGLRIATTPTDHNGETEFEEYDVPGRVMKLTRSLGQMASTTREYDVSFPAVGNTEAERRAYLHSNLRNIKSWLMSSTAWTKLSDTYDPDIFYKARCNSDMEFTLLRDEVAQGKITFTVDPRKFLNSGNAYYRISNGSYIDNPGMTSYPILLIPCTAANATCRVTTTIDGQLKTYLISFPNAAGLTFEIDCESMSVYRVDGNSYSAGGAYMSRLSEFPKLGPGRSTFILSGVSATGTKIMPRWWQP